MNSDNQLSINFRRFIAGFLELGVLPYISLTVFDISDLVNNNNFTVLAYSFWLLIFWYTLSKDSFFDGQSLMKKLLKIKVVRFKDSSKCTVLQSITRNVLFWLPLAFVVESIWIFYEANGRRGGDYLAGTVVVDAK
jgi:uncharacterized RDD family membrane protein YckC